VFLVSEGLARLATRRFKPGVPGTRPMRAAFVLGGPADQPDLVVAGGDDVVLARCPT
jgi:hypothetical protein